MKYSIAVLILTAAPALADCGSDKLGFACDIGAKRMEICVAAQGLRYQFGPAGAPELTIDQGFDQTGYRPWAGVGRAIYDEVRFTTNGHDYYVWQSLDRLFDEGQPAPGWQGGIYVEKGGTNLLSKDCAPDSVVAEMDLIAKALETAGYCWNLDTQVWGRNCD